MGVDEVVFGMRDHRTGDTLVIELLGELDIWAYQQLLPGLDDLLFRHRGGILVDLRPTTFLDAGGVRLLLRIHRQQSRAGRRPQLLPGDAQVTRVLHLLRLDQVFDPADPPLAAPPPADRAPPAVMPAATVPAPRSARDVIVPDRTPADTGREWSG